MNTDLACKGAAVAFKSMGEIIENSVPTLGFFFIAAVVAGVIVWHVMAHLWDKADGVK